MMKVLFVCSGNFTGLFEHKMVFVHEVREALISKGIKIDVFLVKGKGLFGYLKSIFNFWKIVFNSDYDLIHAYYGLSGLLACLQLSKPVITTFLGSDINLPNIRRISKIVYSISSFSIFVDKKLAQLINAKKKYVVQSLGIDLATFSPIEKTVSREKVGFSQSDKVILFSSSFDRKEKNFFLAKKALDSLEQSFSIIELGKSYSREYLNLLYNVADVFLLTSFTEGSPQTIKEAMACNCPIVTTDVGDIKEIISDTEGCFMTSFDPADVADKIKLALDFGKRTNGREKIKHLDNKLIAEKILEVYKEVLKKK